MPVWVDNLTVPGWYSWFEAGLGSSPGNYTIDNGSLSTGGLYSYGSVASSDRAIGLLSTPATDTTRFGYHYINDQSYTITCFNIKYRGEQWRSGGSLANQLIFDYSTSALALGGPGSGGYTIVPYFNFVSPNTTNSGAIDGNLPGNSELFDGTLTPVVPLAPGDDIWFRWSMVNDPTAPHGLGIDDFEISACTCPASASSSSSAFGCNCEIQVDLMSSLPSPCGIEIVGNNLYAIGDQQITYLLSDPCDCLVALLINGQGQPATVSDGDLIEVELFYSDFCEACLGGFQYLQCIETIFLMSNEGSRNFLPLGKFLTRRKKKNKPTLF